MIEAGALQELDTKVIKTGLCTLCGACVGTCPYMVAYEGRVLVKDVCDLPQGRCQAVCPRISLDLDHLSRVAFGVPYPDEELGTVARVVMARTTDPAIKARAQDGGAVTTLISFAIEEGWIDSAILTGFEDKSWPRGVISRRECSLMRARSQKPLYRMDVAAHQCRGETCGCNRFCTRVFRCPGLRWNATTKKAEIDQAICAGCGVCVDICPQSAITREQVR